MKYKNIRYISNSLPEFATEPELTGMQLIKLTNMLGIIKYNSVTTFLIKSTPPNIHTLLNYQQHHDITIGEEIIERSKDDTCDCLLNALQHMKAPKSTQNVISIQSKKKVG